MSDWAQELIDEISDSKDWPLPREADILENIRLHSALRRSDAVALKPRDWSSDRHYVVDPLGKRIVGAKADLVFGEDPIFTAATEQDQPALDGLVTDNKLPSQLQGAERVCSGEGEVWWRVYANALMRYPCIQWLSREFVVPLFQGQILVAAAFVSELDLLPKDNKVYRHVEVQADGIVRNYLFAADKSSHSIGDEVSLDAHPDTRDLLEEWNHGLGLLCGRILNDEDLDPSFGISDFEGVEDLLLALNEATTIGTENARQTAKVRLAVPSSYLDESGKFPAGADIIVIPETDRDPDKPDAGLTQIEWSFDAGALKEWIDHLVDTCLTRTRTAPQLVGRNTEGAQTGPALRARLLDSVLDAHGKGRYWDDGLPQCLLAAQQVDALSEEDGGLGNDWTRPSEPPAVERQSVLPEDETERSQRVTAEFGALLKSRRTAIEDLHPDWSEDQVEEEVQRINAESGPPELPA